MGMSARAHLYYGYDFGGQDGWNIHEIDDEFGPWQPAWIDASDDEDEHDYAGLVERRLLEVLAGFTVRTADRDDRYWESYRAARKEIGVEFEPYGYEYGQHALTTYHLQVEWGDTRQLDLADLERQRLADSWDAALDRAIQALGITPTKPRGWFIAASYS